MTEATQDPTQRRFGTWLVLIAAAMLTTVPAATTALPGHGHDDEHPAASISLDTHPGSDDHHAAHALGAPGEGGQIQVVPGAAEGFLVQALAPSTAPTVLSFGPDPTPDPAGPSQDLYLATLTGEVQRLDLAWTPVGPVVTEQATVAGGFSQPLGIAFDDEGHLYVSDSDTNDAADRPVGVVYKIDLDTGEQTAVVDGLPNGQHNTNHIRFGPDGRLYMPNGNPNDHGNGTGTGHTDIFPYSGAFLSVDPDVVDEDPAILYWEDEDGNEIDDDGIVDHPRNQDFADKVDVLGYGFRNNFDIAFAPEDLPFGGAAYTGVNGADSPASQDTVYKVEPGQHHGYPFCYDVGPTGATGDAIDKVTAPDSPNPSFPCEDKPEATALLGWHVCATGVDFPTDAQEGYPDASFPSSMQQSLYVGECTPFQAQSLLDHVLDEPSTHNTAHKVARIPLDDGGEATAVDDFLTGLALPTDVQFGPDGAMYVADAGQILRVAGTPAARALDTVDELAAPLDDATRQGDGVPVAAVGQSFLPQITVVPVDQPVEWTQGAIPHTITTSDTLCPVEDCDDQANDPGGDTDDDPDTFDVVLSSPLSSYTHAFEDPGVYPYFCKFHDAMGMVGVVVVVDPGDPTAVGPEDVLDALPSAA